MDGALFKKINLKKDCVFEFLMGLNADLDDLRGYILGKEPLPFTREIFSKVKEESRKKVIMRKNPVSASTENSTLNSITIETTTAITN